MGPKYQVYIRKYYNAVKDYNNYIVNRTGFDFTHNLH